MILKNTLLPPIPNKLWKIDDSTVGQHFSLATTDQCFYIWEYAAGKGYSFSPSNQLVWNLKIKPTVCAKEPARARYKQQAIQHAALALRSLMPVSFVDGRATFVPVPGSKAAKDPDYDDRLLQVLRQAFSGWSADVRVMLKLTESTAADHENDKRLAFDELLDITRLVSPSGIPPRPIVVIVDDVLNSGKHFKVAQSRILERFPRLQIRGVFLARCIHEPETREFDVPLVD
jgi:hypothetical protein